MNAMLVYTLPTLCPGLLTYSPSASLGHTLSLTLSALLSLGLRLGPLLSLHLNLDFSEWSSLRSLNDGRSLVNRLDRVMLALGERLAVDDSHFVAYPCR